MIIRLAAVGVGILFALGLRGAEADDLDLAPIVELLVEIDDPAVQLDLLRGMLEGLRGQKATAAPPAWAGLYPQLSASPAAEVRTAARLLALAFGDARAGEELRQTALDPAAPVEERAAALQALAGAGDSSLAATLHQLLDDRPLRQAALRQLAAAPHQDTPRLVLDRYPRLTPAERQDAILALASRREFATALLDALQAGRIPPGDVSAYAARQLAQLGDEQIRIRLGQLWGEIRDTPQQKQQLIRQYKALLSDEFLQQADLSQGRLVFRQTCQQCHLLYGAGESIGPDLTGSNRSDLDYLLSNIIDPNAEIGRDYQMSVLALDDGRVLTGLIVDRSGGSLTLQTATQQLVIADEDVVEHKHSEVSLMPEGQLEQLTQDQIRDLIAYLVGREQVPLPPEEN